MNRLFISVLFLLNGVEAIRTKEAWTRLFTVDPDSSFHAKSEVHDSQRLYFNEDNKNVKHPIVFQFVEACGIYCHEKVSTKVNAYHLHSPNQLGAHLIHPSVTEESPKHFYSIIDSTHALVHVDLSLAKEIAAEFPDLVVDFAPVLPSFKVHENVDMASLCPTGEESLNKEIELYVMFFPQGEEDLTSLRTEVKAASVKTANNVVQSPYRVHATDLHTLAAHDSSSLSVQVYCPDVEEVVRQFATRPDVQWVEVRHTMRSLIRWAKNITQTGLYNEGPLQYLGVTGKGRIIGIADTGLDDESCYFKDPNAGFPFDYLNLSHRKVVHYDTYVDAEDGDGHGTAVSGTAAGLCGQGYGFQDEDGTIANSDAAPLYDGQASDAKIAFFDIGSGGGDTASSLSVPGDAKNNLYKPLYNRGARVLSMSWGSSANSYTNDARYVDDFMWNYHDSLILHAAGNSGQNDNTFASVPNSVGSPATNKNGVSVGASSNDERSWNFQGVVNNDGTKYNRDSLAGFSSRGPTSDGRVKPDVCAVGWDVQAPLHDETLLLEDHCAVEPISGTSFSCPLLAGTAVLIEQYFVEGWYGTGTKNGSTGFTPSGALLKAMLIHGAQPLLQIQKGDSETEETEWLDSNQGFGRAQVDMSLNFNVNATRDGLTQFVLGASDTSSEHYVAMTTCTTHTYDFTVVATADLPSGQDAPRTVYATLAYTDYPGPVGSGAALINDLDLKITSGGTTYAAVREDDRKNNVEMVKLENPVAGQTYTVEVSCHSLSYSQPYALVLTGENGKVAVPHSEDLDLGLSNLAITAIAVMSGITCCLTLCVYWIAYGSSKRKATLKEANSQYAIQLAEQKEKNAAKKKARLERQRRKNQGAAMTKV